MCTGGYIAPLGSAFAARSASGPIVERRAPAPSRSADRDAGPSANTEGDAGGSHPIGDARPLHAGAGDVDAVVRRLVEVAPDVPVVDILEIVHEAFSRTADARIQTYRLVLAERHARGQLRSRVAEGERDENASRDGSNRPRAPHRER